MYSIRKINRDDIFQIMTWRNAQMDVLRQKKKLTKEVQQRYYEQVILPSYNVRKPDLLLYSLIYNNRIVGYGGFVHISWADLRAEMSFLVETSRTHEKEIYKSDFSNFIKLMKEKAFAQLGFNKIFTETYSFRVYHMSILEENGFVKEGILRKHVIINNKFYDSIFHGYLKENYELEK